MAFVLVSVSPDHVKRGFSSQSFAITCVDADLIDADSQFVVLYLAADDSVVKEFGQGFVIGPTEIDFDWNDTSPALVKGALYYIAVNYTLAAVPLQTNHIAFTVDANPPTISDTATPNSGATAGGTSVAVTGTGWDVGDSGPSAVFEMPTGNPVTTTAGPTDTTATFTSEAHAAGGVKITVTTDDGTAETTVNAFTFTGGVAAPTVTAISPTRGIQAGGQAITDLTGTGFVNNSPGTNVVKIGGVSCTSVVAVSDIKITCVTPAGTAGAKDVTVQNNNGTGTLTNGYTYNASPTVTAITPVRGPQAGGTAITDLAGTGFSNFSPGTNTVKIDGVSCTSVSVISDIKITCTSPAGSAGAKNVTVQNNNGTGTLTSGWTYNAAPTVTSLETATSGPQSGGTAIQIAGTGFSNFSPGTNSVKVDGVACTSVVPVSDTRITCVTPAGSAGAKNVTVQNANGTGTLVNGFTYNASPVLTSTSPDHGPKAGGTALALVGVGFSNNSPGTNSITIDGVACTSVVVNSDVSISCVAPAGATVGAKSMVLSNANGTSGTITYTYNALPTATSATPNFGTTAGGTSIVIAGSGFSNFQPGTNTVTVGGNAATSVVVNSDISITCTTPAGTAGAKDVVVTNANGVGTATGAFTYVTPPSTAWTTLVPTPAVAQRGKTTTISVDLTWTTGTLSASPTFAIRTNADAAVQSGSNVVQGTSASGHWAGTVDFVLAASATKAATDKIFATATNGNGGLTGTISGDSGASSFAVTANPPTVTSITPSTGASAGGTAITNLAGTGFHISGFSATIGGAAITGLSSNGAGTAATGTSPAGTAGSRDVVVTTADGTATLVGGFVYDPAPPGPGQLRHFQLP